MWTKEKLPVDERTPYLGKFVFCDMVCEDASACGGFFYGLPEAPIASITLQNVSISFKENPELKKPAMMSYLQPMKQKGLYLKNVDEVILKNVQINNFRGSPITRSNIGKITGRLAKEVL